MNKKGFTLIELLAVIVVLAIIAMIAVPMILGVVEKSKKGAAVSSAYGYIDAVEKYMLLHTLDSTKYPVELMPGETYQVSSKEFRNTTAYINLIDKVYAESVIHINDFITVKGNKPSSGIITIGEKNTVASAQLVTNGYLVACNGKKCEAKRKMVVDKTAPVISNVSATAERRSITINYTANDPESGIDHVKCYYKKSSDSSYTNSVDGNNGVCEVTGLNSDTDYDYKIEATNYDGLLSNIQNQAKTQFIPCEIIEQAGDTLAVGDIIACGSEEFYYIGDEGTNVKMLTKYELNNNNQVSSGGQTIRIGALNYWNNNESNLTGSYNGNPALYVYNPSIAYCAESEIYSLINNYANKIKNRGLSSASGRLMSYEEANVLSTNIRKAISTSNYWLGSAVSNYQMYGIDNSGTIITIDWSDRTCRKQYCQWTTAILSGIRPLILIPKDEL